jgi:hypothetical protein
MKQVGILTLASVIATAAAPRASATQNGVTLATAKSLDQFGGCFVAAQERASLAWSYVPKTDGGTFSNLGARGAGAVYYLALSERGKVRQIHLEAATPASPIDARVARAVDQCA